MKPLFASAANFFTVNTMEFVMARIYIFDISHYAQKERLGAQRKNRGYITAAKRAETWCTLVIFLLITAMFPDGIKPYVSRRRIATSQTRLAEVARTMRDY